MDSIRKADNVVPLFEASATLPMVWSMLELASIESDGTLTVRCPSGALEPALWLNNGAIVAVPLAVGDAVLVGRLPGSPSHIVFGRVEPYRTAAPRVAIEAAESLSLRCGEASVELRADGKLMLRGEDVLLRAKGTQRIRAGNVAIN